jgi:chromosome segregation protein
MLSPFEVKINSDLLIEEKSRELKKLLEDKNLKESKQTNLIKEIYELNNKIKALQNTLQTAKRKEEEKNKALMQKGRIAQIEKEMVKKKTAAQNIESEIKLLVSQINSLSEKGILSEKRKKLDELKNSLHRETMLLKDIQYKADTIGNDIKHAEIRLKSTNRNTESLIEENKNLEINLKIAKQDLFQSERAYNKLKLDIAELQSIEKEIKEKTTDIEKEIKRINLEISRMEEQKENILKKIEKQHIAMAEKNTQINNIKERMREKGIKEREILYEIDEKKIKIEISSVKAKIQSLGAIDFTSVEEEEQVKEEFKKKESIYKDVLSSKKELESFIKEMEKRTHEEFENTLQGVEKYFSVFFRRMFKGGNANIERTMDEKKEVKGIELSVRLPGKKKQSLPLLSGGEKSLTTLAFLFAIFKVRPAPFYVLDEVDAALDEENVIKFGELLGEEADFAQFIVITHNKETMQKADMLYGITMEEDGISKVVSLKLV